jgi:hypothetical protein
VCTLRGLPRTHLPVDLGCGENRLLTIAIGRYDKLTTALYPRGDPYKTSDPVFGLKESLVVGLKEVDEVTAKKYNVQEYYKKEL